MKSKLNSRSIYQAVIHVILVALAIEVLVLSGENSAFKKGNTYVERLERGDTFSLNGVLFSGHSSADKLCKNQVIFIFTTSCPFCKKSIPAWNKLAAKVGRCSFGISLDEAKETRRYVLENSITFPVYTVANSTEFREGNKIRGIPKTVIRNKKGVVVEVHHGQFRDEGMTAFEKLIVSN